ncbi:MAG: endonuclease NucS [Alphaproteobacteria bacterium]|nr:endonuclease NucS [Alphaproteobacteria bacterium]
MATLVWKKKTDIDRPAATPFKSEEQLETLVCKTPEILENVFVLGRQVRIGSGVLDLVGIDDDGNICIIEVKKVPVDADIIPQLLKYAFWAEKNPDSIKALWLERDTTPDDLSINWDSVEVRIIVIAPQIKRETMDFVERVTYDVELIEVTQWVDGDDTFLLVDRLEADKSSAKVRIVGGQQVYDEAFYKKWRNTKSVDAFLQYVREVHDLSVAKKWNLEKKFNKNHCSFKLGSSNAFGVKWLGTASFAFFVRLTEQEAKQACPNFEWHSSTRDGRVVYPIKIGETKTPDYEKLFRLAYKKLAG